jgi:tetratricopeptide (TPR) repeat protein
MIAAGLWLANAWQQTQRREAFLPQLETMARRSPDGPLLALLGGRLAEAHEPTAADTLRRAVVAGEGTALVWQALAATTAAAGDRPRALADLKLGRKARGTAPALDDALARAEALGPAPDPAALAQAIAPEGPAPLVDAYTRGSLLNGLARWWGRRSPEGSGFATRQEWARQAPDDAQAQRLWGLALRQNRRLPEAGMALARAVALAPRSPAAHLALADALEQGSLREKAGLEYIACLKLHRDWLPALLGLGQNALKDHLDHAVPAYRRATQIAPKSADAWIGLGHAYFQNASTYSKALAAFQEAARLAPDRTDFFDSYAEALRETSRVAGAEALLRRRLRTAPDDAQCHYLLGTVLLDQASSPAGEAAAEAETREALRLSPRQPLAEGQLARLLLQRGEAPAAVLLLQDALAFKPYDVNTLNVLTRAAQQAGDIKTAEAVSARSQSVFRNQQRLRVLEAQEHKDLMNQQIHQQMAQLYKDTGQPERARQEQELMRLLRTDPQQVARERRFLRSSLQQVLPDGGP